MQRWIWAFLIVMVLPAVNARAVSFPETDLPANVSLRLFVYDYSRSDYGLLEQSMLAHEKILDGAGIESQWLLCFGTPGRPVNTAACRQPLGPGDFVIRFLTGIPRPANGGQGRVLGESIAARSMGAYINVYPNAVPASDLNRKAHILGHTIAHELGHLLLASEDHSTEGIMKTNWSENDWTRMDSGSVKFERKQSLKMRHQLELRLRSLKTGISS